MKSRTRIEFQSPSDPWPVIERWAAQEGFAQKSSSSEGKLYQKGLGLVVAPMMLNVSQQGDRFVLEAWVRSNVFVRLMALFILPAEMHVASGGFIAMVPRSIARNAINKLLTQLQQPLIG